MPHLNVMHHDTRPKSVQCHVSTRPGRASTQARKRDVRVLEQLFRDERQRAGRPPVGRAVGESCGQPCAPAGAARGTFEGRKLRNLKIKMSNYETIINHKHETTQTQFKGCASVLNAGRAGSRPHSSQPAQLAGFPFWRRQQYETEHSTKIRRKSPSQS